MLLTFVCISIYADEWYLVGGCTDSGWNAGESTRSSVRAYTSDGTTWVWAGKLTTAEGDAGRFKIPNSTNGWDGIWATTDNQLLSSDWSDLSTENIDNNDYKFRVESAGYYLITFNSSTKKIKAEKLTAEPTKDGDYYQISNVDEYYWFAAYIATDNTKNAKARLTANLDFSGKTFLPLASAKHTFNGELDGADFIISNAVVKGTYNYVGLFTYITGGANVHDLIIDETCSFTGNAKVGGIAGFASNGGEVTLTNVINKANVTSVGSTDANAAGLIGCASGGTKITAKNCANTGTVKGQDGQCAAFAGWTQNGTTFTNCWNSGDINNIEGSAQLYRNSGSVTATNCYDLTNKGNQGTKVDAAKIATGEFCYILNGDQSNIVWYQTLGDGGDATPVPFSDGHAQVYANGELNCDGSSAGGELTYSNSSTSVVPPHTNVNGWCTVCGTLDQNYITPDVDGFYGIGTANDLYWFTEIVKQVNTSAKAKLVDNIDYTDYKQGFIGASSGSAFSGVFDGQEHTISIDIKNNGTNRTGLFAYINAATIKNLIVEGSATSDGNNCVGGLGGRSDSDGTLIENVIVKTAVSYTGSNGDATCGGFFANMEGQVTLKNCAFLGSIKTGTAEGNGGLVGWAGGGNNNKYINCLVAPVEYTKNGNSADFARNNPSTTNCHKVAADDTSFASGELCYKLNAGGDNWYQNLTGDIDAKPVPFSSHSKVYANASYYCDGTPKGDIVYGNNDEESRDKHDIENGFCTVCNSMIEYIADYMEPATDGYYEISDNKQMRWFAAMVKDYRNAHNITANADANAAVNARLMNDIDFTGVKDFAPIGGLWGQGNTRYAGTFDGQGYQITNLSVDLDQDNVGVFGVVAENAVIKNFILASTCSITGNAHVGIVGEVWRSHDGEVHLECLGNEAAITGKGNNVGGILGVNMTNGGYAKLYMTNCYTTGAIKGGNENGQLTGWSGDNAVIENCYAIGGTTNCDGFGRFGNGSSITNCYCDKDLTWNNHPTKVSTAQLESGEIAYKLGDAFSQLIGADTYPVFGSMKVNYVGEAGYATMYDTTTGYELNGDVKAYAATFKNTWLELNEVENVPASTPVILKGSYYNKIAKDLASLNIVNVLQGAAEEIDAAGKYILAMPDANPVGFYLAESGKIAAGKAYLEIASNVKAFYFDGDGETAINGLTPALSESGAIYNVAGQRINKLQKGINIVNGKKVLK